MKEQKVKESLLIDVSNSSIFKNRAECLSFYIGKQKFGIMVEDIQDAIGEINVCPVPMVKQEVFGLINLRGRIVTAINLRSVLNIGENDLAVEDHSSMWIVVYHKDELYSLSVSRLGDVMPLKEESFEQNVPTMRADIKRFSKGVYRMENDILILLDINKIITFLKD